jgi:type IV secretory pathway VirB6-like protein
LNYGEYPSADGTCASGLYVVDGNFTYKKGNKYKENSFFETIQNVMSSVIKLAITLAVAFYGVNLLLWKTSLGDKKSILVFVFKIALVMYFCVGNAWQDVFFRGFYDSSMVLAKILFKVETLQDSKQQDGCQFGTVALPDGTAQTFSTYPDGKEYLAIWDTIDCKMMRYLGFGPQLSNANIASMVIATYFFGPIGIYFAMSVMVFGFFLVSLGIRALHIFISSAAAIILLVFVSPLVIPCAMFEKTKGIFDGWLGKLLSYCFQPMILFAYVAIFITVMDRTLIGSATFHGNAPKTMSCEKICVDSDGELVAYDGDQAPACDEDGQEIINPLDDSVACLLNFQDFGTWKAFSVIGVALPIVENLFKENVKERILTMLKGALVMYLLYKFMDEIPGIIEALIGKTGAFKMLTKAMSVVKGVSERLGRAGGKVASHAAGNVSRAAKHAGNQGKKAGEAEDKEGGEDHSSKTGENGGADSSEKRPDGSQGDSSGGNEGNNDSSSKG